MVIDAMTAGAGPPAGQPAWKALKKHHQQIGGVHLRELFARDPGRGERLAVEACGIYLDYSKNRITDQTVRLLERLAEACGLRGRIDAMFRGNRINVSENRSVLHVALRAPRGASIVIDGQNVVPAVHDVLDRMTDFAGRVRSGAWTGYTGKADPQRRQHRHRRLRSRARSWPMRRSSTTGDRSLTFRFVSNIDGSDFAEAVRDLDPEGDALHRVVQDVHHARDHDQCTDCARAGRWRRSAATSDPSEGTSSPSRPMPVR
jgi:glucose-6-phosphate isomerase